MSVFVRAAERATATPPEWPAGAMLADPFAGTMATRDTSAAWMTFMGIPQDSSGVDAYDRLSDYAKAPADEAWVYACVKRIFSATSSVRLRVYVRAGKELIPWEDAPTPAAEDLQTLLDTANPVDMTGPELRAYAAASRKVWGGWYWLRRRGALLHDTQELYWLRVPDVTPKSSNGRTIDYYEYRPSGPGAVGMEMIQPTDLIRHRGLNLASQIEMVSPLSAARYDMVTDEAAAMQTASILRRRGVPEGYWKGAQGTVITPQDRSAIRRFIRQLTGPHNAGKSLVAPDIEYQTIALPEKDAQWLEARKVSRMMVSAILGVPLVLAGDDEKAGVYASIRDAQKVFWKDTMIPELDGDADTINNWLTPEFNRPRDPVVVVAHDYSTVEAIRPLWTDEVDRYLNMIDHQVAVPDEFRDHFKIGPHVPWGQKPVPRTTITLRPQDVPDLGGNLALTQTADTPPDQAPDNADDLSDMVRAIRKLYGQPAVRAFVAGGQLDTRVLLGRTVNARERKVIEDGLRRRASAGQIADDLAARDADVTDAVIAALHDQWPDKMLDLVRQGTWSYEKDLSLDKVDYDRRPGGRDEAKVARLEAPMKLGAPVKPTVVIDLDAVGKKGYRPLDGYHRYLAADHTGVDELPAYVGEGDKAWTQALLDFLPKVPQP